MQTFIKRSSRLCFALAVVMALSGCSVRFHAAHEPAIIGGLSSLNSEAIAFLASLCPQDPATMEQKTNCTSESSFAQRKPTYDKIVAKAQTVKALVLARPQPKPFIARWFGAESADDARTAIAASPKLSTDGALSTADANRAVLKAFDAPTDEAVDEIAAIFSRLAQKDAQHGLEAGRIAAASLAYRVEMRNALTFEMALDR